LIEHGLGPSDRVAVVETAQPARGLSLTSDRPRLLASAEHLQYHVWQRGAPSGPAFRAESLGQRTLDAVETVVKDLAGRSGRTAVILISDRLSLAGRAESVDPILLDDVQRIIDAAARTSAVIYGVRPQDVPYLHAGDTDGITREMVRRRGELHRYRQSDLHGVSRLAEGTGGLFLGLGAPLDVALALAADEQQGYYLVGYRPDPDAFRPKGGFRSYNEMQVRARRSDVRVRSRTGFYGATDEEMAGTVATVASPVVGQLRPAALAAARHAGRRLLTIGHS
jgi:VWFA-related protein